MNTNCPNLARLDLTDPTERGQRPVHHVLPFTHRALVAPKSYEGGSRPPLRARQAFTLLELLVVIGIIAVIAALAVPSLNAVRPNLLNVASGQMLGDLGWARQRAISDHTTVYVVFIPSVSLLAGTQPANLSAADKQQILQGQFVSYAFYVKRQLGDQPGAPTVRYLTTWKTLPATVAFAPQKFGVIPYGVNYVPSVVSAGGTNICWTFDAGSTLWDPDTNPQPSPANANFPYIAFDYRGSLASSWHTDGAKSGHCVIPLTRGTVAPAKDPTGALAWTGATFNENPAGTWNDPTLHTYIVIDGPTGRAHIEHAQVK